MELIDRGIGLVLFGILILVAGIVVSSYIRSGAVPCDEWYGQLGQFLDSQTRQHCQQANMLQAESSAATIIGMITGALGIVCVGHRPLANHLVEINRD